MHFYAACGRKLWLALRFAATLIRYRGAVVLCSHVNLTPLCLAMSLLHLLAAYAVMGYGVDVWFPVSWLKRRGLRRAAAVLSISSYTTQRLVKVQGVQPSRIHLLPYGYCGDKETRAPAPPTEGRSPSVLTVTRLDATEAYKGVDTVIGALPQILCRYPSVHYTVVGSGSDQERLQALAGELGVGDHVSFRGLVPEEQLAGVYAECDIFVLPSEREGLGIVYLEDMAHAKPVVAARAGGVPEVVIDGQTGLLVEYGDVEALVGTLLVLLGDAALRTRLGNAGHERLTRHFTYEQFAGRLRDALDALLEGRPC
jgi:glycosyltransferase involved in cell wall biosynthesis